MFKIPKTSLLEKVIPMGESGWVTQGPAQRHCLPCGHLPWASSRAAVTVWQGLRLPCVWSFCVYVSVMSVAPRQVQWDFDSLLGAWSCCVFIFFLTLSYWLSAYSAKSENEREGSSNWTLKCLLNVIVAFIVVSFYYSVLTSIIRVYFKIALIVHVLIAYVVKQLLV